MYVCSCHGIDEAEVRVAIGGGACSVDEVIASCRAGSDCGGCHPMIEDILIEETAEATAA